MRMIFRGKKISSVLGILPQRESFFDDEINNYSFPAKQTLKLKKIMGYEKHRLSKPESTVSDFAVCGMDYIFRQQWIKKEEIGAIIVVTLCPDYYVPHISNIIHGKFDLPEDVLCLDIAQGCCGYLVGLMEAFMFLEHMGSKKVVVINGDVLSHKVSEKDRNDFPLIGDGAAITIVENQDGAADIFFDLHMDGKRREALIIPAGGFRMPSTDATSTMEDMGDGNFRALNHMHMDGTEVFSFVQNDVPGLLRDVFSWSNSTLDDFDCFLFHQPNKFMLKKLAENVGIPFEKMPMNLVEKYGNPSGSSIPLTLVENYRETFLQNSYKCCLSAFGSGLAWGAYVMEIGKLNHCEMIVSEL